MINSSGQTFYTLEEAQARANANRGEGGSNNWPVRFNPMAFEEWRLGIEQGLSFKQMQAILSSWKDPSFVK